MLDPLTLTTATGRLQDKWLQETKMYVNHMTQQRERNIWITIVAEQLCLRCVPVITQLLNTRCSLTNQNDLDYIVVEDGVSSATIILQRNNCTLRPSLVVLLIIYQNHCASATSTYDDRKVLLSMRLLPHYTGWSKRQFTDEYWIYNSAKYLNSFNPHVFLCVKWQNSILLILGNELLKMMFFLWNPQICSSWDQPPQENAKCQ